MAIATIKISEEALKELGFNASDFETQVLALAREHKTVKGESATFAVEIKKAVDALSAMEARVIALEGRSVTAVVSDGDRKAITDAAVTAAKAAASSELSAIIAKAGVKAIAGGPEGGNDKPDFAAVVKAKITGGMKEHDAIAACVREFPNEYAAWRANPTPLNKK